MDMAKIAEEVKINENKVISVIVQRITEIHKLNLIPKKWLGRGLLGCQIIPYKD